MRVLLNDDAIIAVDKPPHVLSVPGRVHRVDTEFCPRNVQWMNAISELAATYSHRKEERDSALSLIATKLLEGKHTVPRQKAKFTRFLERVAKVTDQSILNKVWEDLESIDHRLNRFDTSSLPPELISAADFAETIAKSKIFHVHRLDQETSGVLVFAKSSEVARDLGRQFRDREITKTYIAMVIGKVVDQCGTISVPIGPDEGNNPKQKVDHDNGKESLTLYKVIQKDSPMWETAIDQFSEVVVPKDTEISFLELNPETGRYDEFVLICLQCKYDGNSEYFNCVFYMYVVTRTHQLRVHLAHLGHPIVGDSLYFDESRFGVFPCSRLCLHAYKIEFKHPQSLENVVIATN